MVVMQDSGHEWNGVADEAGEFFPASQESFTRAEIVPLLRALDAARTALREHEGRLSLALDGADAGLWDWNPVTGASNWTTQMERLYGVPPEAVTTHDDWRDLVHPGDITSVEAQRNAALHERRSFDLEFRIVLPSGEIRWLSARGRGIYDDKGVLLRVIGINQDITLRKTAEAERDAGYARLRAQWESTPVASFLWKAESGQFRLVEVNPAAEQLSRGTAHRFVGMTAEQIYPDRPDLIEHFHSCLAQQTVVEYCSDYSARGDGAEDVIDFTFAYVAPDAILLHAKDVTDLRRAEEALRFTQSVVDEMTDAAYWITADGRIAYVNKAACAVLGYSRDELLAMSMVDLVAGLTPGQWAGYWEKFVRAGTIRCERTHVRRDGTSLPVEVQSTYVHAAGRAYVCVLARDMSEHKAMEAALRAGEAKFAALFELSPVALTITRVEDGAFLDVNEAFVQLSGYTHDELLGCSALDLMLYADPVERYAIVAAVRQQVRVKGWPVTIRRQDGSLSACLMSVAVESIESVPCFLSGIVDVGPLRKVEADLHTQQSAMLALLENTDSSIWSIDRNYRLTACNSVFWRSLHTSLCSDLTIGASVLQANDDEANTQWRALYDRALDGERFTVEVQRRYAMHGTWTEYRISPVCAADGSVTGVTVLGHDITEQRRAAEQIETQLAEISLYFDTAPAGLAVLDADLRYLRINSLLAAMNGVSVADHIGKSVEEVVPFIANQARNIAAKVLSSGEPITDIELVGETAADPGVTHTWREHWYPIKRSDGAIVGFNVTAEDITESKRMRDLLAHSQELLARAQELGRLGSWEWDLLKGSMEWSQELYRIFGVGRNFPLSYESINALIHPEDRPVNDANVQAALATGNATVYEFRIVRPDGAVRHIFQSIEITRDDAGAPVKVFGIMQDITERRLAEVALRQRERTLNEAERIGQSGSWEYDLASDCVTWSDNMYRIFDADPGLPANNFFERFHQTLIHPDDRAHSQDAYAKAITSGQPYDVEYRVVRKDGGVRHIHAIAALVRDDAEKAQRLLGWVQDVTEQKRAEAERAQLQAKLAQAQKMETIGRLAGGIAHDFNNMLAVVMLRSELALQMVTAGTPLQRSLETIHTTAQRSATLVQQLLGYARKQTIAPRVIDLNATVEGLLPVLGKLIGEEIELLWAPAADLWPVKMDTSQVDQILTNLCVNARDAIDGIGSITVRTSNATFTATTTKTVKAVTPGEYVLLCVADTGSGIESAVLEHIFEPFFTTKGMGKGTGLGLATVEGIVQQNGGHIKVTSMPGAGTTFAVYLPRNRDVAAPPAAAVQRAASDGAVGTVLLVEDETSVLDMAAKVLRMVGYTVLAAATPTEALRLANEHEGAIDLLLTDVIMPVMNGAELAAVLARQRPEIRTLYMSGYPADHLAHRGVLAEDAHFLAKPFNVQTLVGKVQEILSRPAKQTV